MKNGYSPLTQLRMVCQLFRQLSHRGEGGRRFFIEFVCLFHFTRIDCRTHHEHLVSTIDFFFRARPNAPIPVGVFG